VHKQEDRITRFTITPKSLRAALLLSVLTPAPLFAEPSPTARQMLAQAQTQSQQRQVDGELKRITRSLSTTEAPAPAAVAAADLPKPAVEAVVDQDPSMALAPEAQDARVDAPVLTARVEPAIETPAAPAARVAEPLAPAEAKVETPRSLATAVPPQIAAVNEPQPAPSNPVVTAPAPAAADIEKPKPATSTATARDADKTDTAKAERHPTPSPVRATNADGTNKPRTKAVTSHRPRRLGADA
jgi:hypothetical protein